MNSFNNKNIFNVASKKINSLQKNIEKKQKEIDSQKLMLEKLMIINHKHKLLNKENIKEGIYKIKNNLQEYKDKLEILSLYQQFISSGKNEEEIKSVLCNTKLIYATSILAEIFTDLSKLFKNYMDFGDLINIIYDQKNETLSKDNISNKIWIS